LSAMRGEEMPERTISFDHQGAHALRQGDWKIVWSKRMPTEIQWELYNIAEDRCEMNDLAAAHPERVRQMAAQWGAWARRVGVVYDEAAMSAASAKAVNASPPAVDVATPPQSPQASSSDSTDRSAEPDAFELLTPWGERVTAENGWREYPRPGIKRENWICLNGRWDFALIGEEDRWDGGRVENAASDPLLGELPAPPTNWPQKILIPFSPETQLSGVVKSVRPGQVMWYRRTFRVPDAWGNNRVLLHFEAVDWHAVVLCNGKKVAENKGGYVPFSCDVTDALTQQGEQELIVAAWDPTNMGDQAVGKQALPELRKGFRYTPNSGIWQSVWLEPVPRAAHIRGLKITPVADQRAVEIVVDAEGRADGLTASIIAERDATVVVGEPGEALRLELGDAYARWSPENPVLHDLKIELRRGEDVIDTVRSYFALRTIDIAPDAAGMNRIRLNGEPVFQFGPLDQGYWPDGALTPPSEEAVRYDLQYLKTIGCNMVRVHIKVHPRAWY
ncbi:MAG: sugar-binding domain-containing protein, partial [Planctomycetota bacterium]